MNKVNKYIIIIIITAFIFNNLRSQNVGINATGSTPNASAGLDIDFTNKGLLIPRVSLISITDIVTIPSPAISLLVYNTNLTITGGSGTGYYYFDGTNWQKLSTTTGQYWTILGNANTIAGTNFLGTTDNVDLVFKTNNIENMRILTNGDVGIGTSTPLTKLHVLGDAIFQRPTTGSRLYIQTPASDARIFAMNASGTATQNLVLQPNGSAGSVGIGNASPNNKLEITSNTPNTSGLRLTNLTAGSTTFTPNGKALSVDANGDVILVPSVAYSNNWTLFGNANTIAGTNFLGTVDNVNLVFKTNSIEQMRVMTNGDIGIGTTAPEAKLDVKGNLMVRTYSASLNPLTGIYFRDGFGSGTGQEYNMSILAYDHSNAGASADGLSINAYDGVSFCTNSNATRQERMRIDRLGNVGINTTSPTSFLSVNGTADKIGGGAWAVFSDKRVKQNINPYEKGLDYILKIKPVTFEYNGKGGYKIDGKTYVGVLAQEIEQILPSTVRTVKTDDFEDLRVFDASELTFTLINAIKELQQQINELKQENKQLIKRNTQINLVTKKLNDLEAIVNNILKRELK